MAEIIAAAWPDRKIVTRRAPDWLVRFLALFDKSVASVLPMLGRRREASGQRAGDVLGMAFIPAEEAIRASAAYIIENDLAD